jgi:hypothetical protein
MLTVEVKTARYKEENKRKRFTTYSVQPFFHLAICLFWQKPLRVSTHLYVGFLANSVEEL